MQVVHARTPPEMSSGSEAGSYSRLIDFVYHSTLGLTVIKKKKKQPPPEKVLHVRALHRFMLGSKSILGTGSI